jgi:hypothetical protein
MARKCKLSADRDAADAPFETVEETTDRAVHPPFETVGDTDLEIDSTTDAHAELPPPSQEPDVYRPEHSTKDTHTSVISKLTCICRISELLQETRSVSVAMRQVQLEGWHLANLHIHRCFNEGENVPDLEQIFFYRCCAATLGNIESRDRASTASKLPPNLSAVLSWSRERDAVHSGARCLRRKHDQRGDQDDGDQRPQHGCISLPSSPTPVHPVPLRSAERIAAQVQGHEAAC